MVLRAREVTARFLVAKTKEVRMKDFASWINQGDTVYQVDEQLLYHYNGPDATLESSWIVLAQGPQGIQGDVGPTGAQGPTGPQGEGADHGGLTGLGDDDHTQYLRADGSRVLSADWDAGGFEVRARTLESDVATGTAPMVVASTTKVVNLNAERVDGQDRVININADHTHQSTGAEAGKIDHGAALNGLGDDDHASYLLGRADRCHVYNSSAITISDVTNTYLTFNSERFDGNDLHSTVSNTGRITAPTTGYYLIGTNLHWAANAAGRREAWIRRNRTTWLATSRITSDGSTSNPLTHSLVVLAYLTAAQYVEVLVYQNTGGDLDCNVQGEATPAFWAFRVA